MREVDLNPMAEEGAHLKRGRFADETATREPSLWQRFRPRWNHRDRVTFWLPIAIVSVAALGAAYWTEIRTVTATKVEALREAVATHPDFSVRRVEIEGRNQASRDFVLEALSIDADRRSLSSLDLDVAEARARLIRSSWIDDARVALDPSGTLRLRLSERRPVAIWRASGAYWLIDERGEPIVTVDGPGERLDLPYLLGNGAAEAVDDARALLASTPTAVANEILALVRRGDRRWDAISKYGFIIKLPEEGALEALRAYGRSNLGPRLKPRAVLALDLRRPGEPPVLSLERGTNDLRLDALAELRKPDPKRR